MQWISVVFRQVCKCVLHIIKEKNILERGRTKPMKIICQHSVCLWHLLWKTGARHTSIFSWVKLLLCSPGIFSRQADQHSQWQVIFQGNKWEPCPLMSPSGLEIIKKAKDVLCTENIPNSYPPCLLWIVSLTFRQKVSPKPMFMWMSKQILAPWSYKPRRVHFHAAL